MKSEDPDFVTGYNIFGFDFAYMYDRMKEYCNCDKKKSRYCDKYFKYGRVLKNRF